MNQRRTRFSFLGSLLLFLLLFLFALMIGRYPITLDVFFKALFNNDVSFLKERNIILYLRLPRTIIAGLSGIALSLSGLLYQEVFQNKLVSPDLLGVSSGAGVGAAFSIVLGMSSVLISTFSFLAGILTVVLTTLIARIFKGRSSFHLVLSGIIVGGFMSSVLSFIKYFANPETTLSDITYWLMGSFADTTMKEVYILLPIVFVSALIVYLIRWRINIVSLGKEEAQSKGINYLFYRELIIVIATLLTASTVSCCGTISWIGLVVPHIVRLITGRDTTESIPMTITFGGIFMILVDIISRTFTSSEIPLSAVSGLFGTLIFVIIVLINRRNNYEH